MRIFNWSSKSVFATKFACANLALKTLSAKLLNSNIFIMIMISKFLFNLRKFCVITCFLTKLLILGILFSTAVNAALFVAKPLILGIVLSISVMSALSYVFLTSLLVSGILFSSSDLSMSYLVLKTNPLVSIVFFN